MNLKLSNSLIVHKCVKPRFKFAGKEDEWPLWSLCGAAGTYRLKPTEEPITCKLCLTVEAKQ